MGRVVALGGAPGAGGFRDMEGPGCGGIGRCRLCTASAEATGLSRWGEEGEGRGSGMPGREAAPFVRVGGGGGGFLRRKGTQASS